MKLNILKKICIVHYIMLLCILLGCTQTNIPSNNKNEKISIVCTTFPQYDWVKNIIGDNQDIEISIILNNGTDSHSYQASADDIIRIKKSDVFIYNGGQSDSSFHKIVEQNQNHDWIVINLMDNISETLLPEDYLENDIHEHHDKKTFDEHIWLSLKNSIKLCEVITDKIILADPANEDKYKENSSRYIELLSSLDNDFEKTVSYAKRKEFVLVDRYPFKYLVNDYNLICYPAFPGCSSETDASFNTVISLGQKIKELDCAKIAVTENNNTSVVKAIQETMNMESLDIYQMNSIQSVSQSDIDSGLTYISAMKQNLSALESLLN